MSERLPARTDASTDVPAASARIRAAGVAGVCLAVLAVYASLIEAPPLSWDDGLNVFENPYLVRGMWATLWTKAYFGMYVPVISTIWAGLLDLGDGAAWPFR